jgi:hypothetical protein
MHHHMRLLLTSLAATAILALATTTTTANILSISNQQTRIIWSSLELSNTVTTNVVRCAVTLEGSFHNGTIAKIRELLVGYLSRAAVQNNQCTGGRATILSETLPWHLTYNSFRGTLPRIEEVLLNLIRAGFIIEIVGVNSCKAVTSLAIPARGIANLGASGRVESLRADESTSPGIPLTNGPGGFACGLGSSRFSGSASVTQLGSTSSVSVTLVGAPITLEPSPVRFGTVEPGELARRTVTITNVGASQTINSIRVASGNFFAITDPNSCVRSRLAEAARCSFSVIFAAPSEAGRNPRDTVTVEATGGPVEDAVEGST